MKPKRIDLFLLCLCLLPMVVTAAVYGRLPAQIPTHWNLDGSVDYSGKLAILALAVLPLGLLLLMRVLPKVDPRRENYRRFQGAYDTVILATILLMELLYGVTVAEALRPGTVSVGRVTTCAVGVLLAVLGNVMPKFKPSYFTGVRTPWTLSDPDVWNRTQRLGGRMFFVLGIVLVGGGLLLPETANFLLILGGVAGVTIVPTAMSYLWYRQKRAKQ